MKNSIFCFVCLFVLTFSAFAQNDSIQDPYKKDNEIKLNSLLLLIGAVEGYYERNLTETSSVGISALVPYDNDTFDSDLNYYVSPYYRIFFGKKYAAGFFFEGFGMVTSYDEFTFENVGSEVDPVFVTGENTFTNFAIGIGLGGKWITKGGFVFEINTGVGRNLINNASRDDEFDFVGKFGFNLGYRF